METADPRLVGISGRFKGKSIRLGPDELSIGREPGNNFWINDSALSRRHCVVTADSAMFILRDLKSRNGTFVNGNQVDEWELQHGDQISLGDSTLIFLLDDRETRLERNPVQITDTSEQSPAPVLLSPKDAVYLRSAVDGEGANGQAAADLNALLRLAIGIGSINDWESLQWQLLGAIFDLVPAERGAILLCDSPESVTSIAAWDRVMGPAHPVRISRTVLRRVLGEGVGLLLKEIGTDKAIAKAESVTELEIQSLLCTPLVTSGSVQGAIYLDSRITNLDEHHLQLMTAVAGITALALERIRQCEGLEKENRQLRAQIDLEHDMVGASPRMQEVFEFIRKVAPIDSTVLIQGESGTGKELVARALHRNSPRSTETFVAINCATLSETLLESELFGHEKGAFTGAVSQKKGKLEVADGGTLFLDEVSEMATLLQAKLLRVLQEREFERVGGTKPIKVNVRLVAATNKNLAEAVEAGSFRKDLLYRLNVVALTLPALRDRREDIPALAAHFVAKVSRKCRMRSKRLSTEALNCLQSYEWPGNVRELENAIERAMVLGSGDVIDAEELPEDVIEGGPATTASLTKYHGAVKDLKKQLVARAFQESNGNYIEAAKSLGMHPNSFLRLVRKLGLKASGATPKPLGA